MASSPSPAPAPDYNAAAQTTAAGNAANLAAQTQANRVNQVSPLGNLTWTQGKNADGTGNNQWTQTETLSPQLQASLNSQLAVQQNQSSLAQGMQGQVSSTMANGFKAPQYSTSALPSVNANFAGFNPSAGGIQSTLNSAGQSVNTNAAGAVAPAGSVNTAAPSFSDATAQNGATAAYNAQMGLLQPQMTQDTANLDAQLRNQGLTPGTTAYNNAMQNLQRTQAQTTTTAANNAVQTGNNEANANYASELAGFGAGNAAQNQAYGQNSNTFTLGNQALGQQYSQDANTMSANNAAQAQTYGQQFGTYGANQTAQTNANAAQAQAFGQNLQNYDTNYGSAYQNYMTPLNSLNAVLSGNQVSMPSFASYTSAGYTPGADMSGAASSLGQYNSGVSAQGAANASSTNNMIAGLGSAAVMAMAMY